MFRGDSYPFALIDSDTGEAEFYDGTIFSMFEMTDALIEHWRMLVLEENRKELRDLDIPRRAADTIILRDRVFPLLGVLKGRLQPDYVRVYTKRHDDDVEIIAGQSYYFDKGKPLEFKVKK